MKKRRVNYNLTNTQHQVLTQEARTQEISASELLRRILDDWIKTNDKNIQIQIVSNEKPDTSD